MTDRLFAPARRAPWRVESSPVRNGHPRRSALGGAGSRADRGALSSWKPSSSAPCRHGLGTEHCRRAPL